MGLPYATHRYLIEPLSGEKHVKLVLIKRFVSFMEKIDQSCKSSLKMLKQEALKDVRSVTGTNFRGIMLLMGDMNLKKVTPHNLETVQYRNIPEEDQWKINIAKELSDVMNDDAEVEGFDWMELKDIIEDLCVF